MKNFLIRVLVFCSIPFYIVFCLIISMIGLAHDMGLAIVDAIRRNDR